MAAGHVPVEGRVHKARVVERDQQAQAPKRVGGRRQGGGRAGGAKVGGVEDGVREDRGREEPARFATASQRAAQHERTGCRDRRGQASDRPPVPHRRDSLPRGPTPRACNDGDVYARAEVANRPTTIIRPRARHNEQYDAQEAREGCPNKERVPAWHAGAEAT
jgi:hypothetical protein